MTDGHIGEVCGIFTIKELLGEKDNSGHKLYKCVCNKCGYEKICSYGNVHGKSQIATICNHVKQVGEYTVPVREWKIKRIGGIYKNMIRRCTNPKDKDYVSYGKRGISVCDEWMRDQRMFEDWAIANGYDDGMSIDRIDPDRGYSPDNCRWIPLAENSRRAGKVNNINAGGMSLTGRQWAEKLGVGKNKINKLLRERGEKETIEFILNRMNATNN